MVSWLGLALALGLLCTASAQSPPCASDETLNTTTNICNCNSSLYTPAALPPNATVECLSGQMTLNWSRCQLESSHYDSANLHLLDPTCGGTRVDNGIALIVVSTNTSAQQCGNQISVDGSYVVYSNNVTIPGAVSHGLILKRNVSFSFSCSYPLNLSVHLANAIRPVLGVQDIPLPGGVGTVTVVMSAYTDSSFTVPYTDTTPPFSSDSPLYLSVMAPDLDASLFSVSVLRLYATATADPNAGQQYDIISGGCPVSGLGELLTVVKNGITSEARFTIQVFQISGEPSVYLFATLQICQNNCTQTCSSARFAARTGASGQIGAGPFDAGFQSSGASDRFSWSWAVNFLLLSLLGLRLV